MFKDVPMGEARDRGHALSRDGAVRRGGDVTEDGDAPGERRVAVGPGRSCELEGRGAWGAEAGEEWAALVRRLEPVIERMTDACVILDVESRIAGWNSAARRLFGPETSGMMGKKPGEGLVAASAWGDFQGIYSQAGPAGLSTSAVFELLAATGSRGRVGMSYEWRVAALARPDGAVVGYTAMIVPRDSGEAAAATGFPDEAWATIFEHTPVPALLLDGNVTVVRANRAACELFRSSAGTLHGRSLEHLIACPQGPEGGACGRDDACECGGVMMALRRAMASGQALTGREVRQKLLPGRADRNAFLRVSGFPVSLGGRAGMVLNLEDVTEFRRCENRLREHAMLVAASEDAICVADMGGRIHFWSAGAEKLFGWSAKEAADRTVTDVMFGGASYVWSGLRGLVVETGTWEGPLEPFNRKKEVLSVRGRVWLKQGHEGGEPSVVIMATDLTRNRQLEKQLLRAQRLESVGTLACGIVHDLNNVLTPVQMTAELLRPSVTGADGERFLNLLVRSAARGVEITRQLLLFGRGSEGGFATLDLRSLVSETVKILAGTLPKSIQLRPNLSEELWPVLGDATQVHQVLMNLCVNARDAMPDGGVMTVAVRNVELDDAGARRVTGGRAGRYAVLSVRDTGVGISREVLDRIFEPFFTTKLPVAGTGLGLSMVQGIVRDHRGFVTVATEEGHGSEFAVYLPVTDEKPRNPGREERSPRRSGNNEWVLVVEDDDVIRELIQTTLERAGYRVITAADGAEGISVFGRRHEEIAVVVMDMMLPLIDGTTAIGMFRRLEPGVELVVMSGLPSQRSAAEKATGGRYRFLQKPLEVEKLLQVVGVAVEEGKVAGRATRPA